MGWDSDDGPTQNSTVAKKEELKTTFFLVKHVYSFLASSKF
jgi:hypothetical protein